MPGISYFSRHSGQNASGASKFKDADNKQIKFIGSLPERHESDPPPSTLLKKEIMNNSLFEDISISAPEIQDSLNSSKIAGLFEPIISKKYQFDTKRSKLGPKDETMPLKTNSRGTAQSGKPLLESIEEQPTHSDLFANTSSSNCGLGHHKNSMNFQIRADSGFNKTSSVNDILMDTMIATSINRPELGRSNPCVKTEVTETPKNQISHLENHDHHASVESPRKILPIDPIVGEATLAAAAAATKSKLSTKGNSFLSRIVKGVASLTNNHNSTNQVSTRASATLQDKSVIYPPDSSTALKYPVQGSKNRAAIPLLPYDSKDLVDAQEPQKIVSKEKPTAEQRQARALAERERRLEEVLSVLEGRKVLPIGMEHLQFLNFLGDGTYGFVVTAQENEGGPEVAVKFIFKDKIPSTAWQNDTKYGRIPTEIHYLNILSHPNLVKLINCFQDDKYIIAVTELHGTSWDSANPVLAHGLRLGNYEGLRLTPRAQRVGSEGKGDLNTLSSLSTKQRQMLRPRVSCDLFECIDAHDYFPEHIVRHIFRQVVNVVAYLHSQDIVHRDLKDENIVIDENYNIKLIDFGSAAKIPGQSDKLFDKFLGTMDFAAPEIIEGFKYRGPEVEIWALGVLLYILVFRQIPFKSQQDAVNVNYKKPSELQDYYPSAIKLYDLLDKILVHDPNHRLQIREVQMHPWMV